MKSLLFSTILLTAAVWCGALFGGDSGWEKSPENPVLGGDLGVCFDVALLHDEGKYKMWFSWRPKKSIAYVESGDGINWSEPVIVLSPAGGWESDLNRPGILKKGGVYHLWYTGQTPTESRIGYAVSKNGVDWVRQGGGPVLEPTEPWEKVAVMCPHPLWDEKAGLFRLWYSAGEQYEPNAIGAATSPDGVHWTKRSDNPIFSADPSAAWERHKVTAAQIFPYNGRFYMFYIGFENEHLARIGLARSDDGVSGWERYAGNPILSPTPGQWDADSCYKPFVIYDAGERRWRLWYNGRRGTVEQIGLATHDGDAPAEGF